MLWKEYLLHELCNYSILIGSLLLTTVSFGQETAGSTAPCLTLEGTITNPAIYIQNPEDGDGNGFCVDSVCVNNIPLQDSLFNQSAFEIDFTQFGLKTGDAVFVKIYHKQECKPKLLTNGYLPRNTGVQFLEIKVD